MLKEWHNRKVFCKSFFRFVSTQYLLALSVHFSSRVPASPSSRSDRTSSRRSSSTSSSPSSRPSSTLSSCRSPPRQRQSKRTSVRSERFFRVWPFDERIHRPCLHRVADKAIANCSRQWRGWTERVFERTIKRFSPIICKFVRPAGAELSHLWRDQ